MSNKHWRVIAEGRGFFYLFLIWAIVVRLIALYQKEFLESEIIAFHKSYLWVLLERYLTNNYINSLISFLLLTFVAIFINMSNVSSNFLKFRTFMPPMFAFLFLSSQRVYFSLSPIIIIACIWTYLIFLLFKNYTTGRKEEFAAQIGFYFALSTLFYPSLILYFPIIYIGMQQMQEINYRSWLAIFFGMSLWYIPYITLIFFVGDINSFFVNISKYFDVSHYHMPLIAFDHSQFVLLVFIAIIQIILTVKNTINRYGDKINVARSINMLVLFEICSLLFIMCIPTLFYPSLTILLICYALHISHFFTSIENKNLMVKPFILLVLIFFAFSINALIL